MLFPQGHLRRAFVQLADIQSADFDIVGYLGTLARCNVDVLGVTASGVLLTDHTGASDLVAATSEQTRALELQQLRNDEGPGLDARRSGTTVRCPDLAADDRWPTFTQAALAAGFAAVHTLPMRLNNLTIGAVDLFSARSGSLCAEAAEIGQTLADVATISVLNERATCRQEALARQLQTALSSRVVIEQAKGVLAERLHLAVTDAFSVLRGYARSHNAVLADVAQAVVHGRLSITPPLPRPRLPRSPDAA